MSLPMETILGITAAALIGVGGMVVILPKASQDTAKPEVCKEYERDEAGKCTVKILGQKTETTTEMTTEERVKRVEMMAETIKERLDSLEEILKEKKDTSRVSSDK